MTVYEKYDSCNRDGVSVDGFMESVLTASGFTKPQSEILTEIINAFIDDASRDLQCAMKSRTPVLEAQGMLRNSMEAMAKEISASGAAEKESLLKRFWNLLVGSLRKNHWHELQEVLKDKSVKEIDQAFEEMAFDAAPEGEIAEHFSDVTNSISDLEAGKWSQQWLEALQRDSNAGEKEAVPEVIRQGLDTDILSAAECTLKKLLALDLLLAKVLEAQPDENMRHEAPFVALASAKRAFTEINAIKSTIKIQRLSAWMLSESGEAAHE